MRTLFCCIAGSLYYYWTDCRVVTIVACRLFQHLAEHGDKYTAPEPEAEPATAELSPKATECAPNRTSMHCMHARRLDLRL